MLRTMRFRGQISQGLLLPVSQFPEIPSTVEVGDDVSEIDNDYVEHYDWMLADRDDLAGYLIADTQFNEENIIEVYIFHACH